MRDPCGSRRISQIFPRERSARAWDDAVREGIDCLEDEALRRATKGGSDRLLEMLLRRRRPEVYARHASETSPRVNVVVTLEEAKRRIRELGLPMLELEGDYEDAGKAGD